MPIKKHIYISGPRMGTNNSMNGIEFPIRKKRKTKRKKINGKK